MPANRKEHLRYRYGICLNDSCSKCKSKEVQQIASRKDFVCEECQKPLRECPPPRSFRDKYGKMIIGATAAVIAAAAATAYLAFPSNEKAEPLNLTPPVEVKDTITVPVPKDSLDTPIGKPDTVTPPVTPAPPVVEEPKEKPTSQPKPKASVTVPFGTYSGPADGLGGEITVTRRYTLNLRNAAHESIELMPGDVITRTKFKNGELVSGYWQRGSEKRSFHR